MIVKTTKKISASEHEEQRNLVEWWRKNQPYLIFAIPNGGGRSLWQGAKLKAEGVMPGVWDLFAPECKLWIEMKKKGGRLSDEQKDFGERMKAAGYECIIGYGFDDAMEKILKIFNKKARQSNEI